MGYFKKLERQWDEEDDKRFAKIRIDYMKYRNKVSAISKDEYDSNKELHGLTLEDIVNLCKKEENSPIDGHKQFGTAVCIVGGTVGGYTFRKGEIFPILGNNNGVHIGFIDKNGDPGDLMCHTWAYNAPVEINGQAIDQDGCTPPFFI